MLKNFKEIRVYLIIKLIIYDIKKIIIKLLQN